MANTEEFKTEIKAQIQRAIRQHRPHLEINAGELHRAVGGYPTKNGEHHNMPSCCAVMREELKRGNAEIVFETASGNAAAFTVRYNLPR
jgi:5-methylcytosine-specific restriction protein A